MKKLYLILLILPLHTWGQAILNGDFESWNSTSSDELTGWYNSNSESVRQVGKLSVTKTSDSQSGFAIKLETVSNGSDTAGAYYVNTPSDPMKGEGGMPFAAMPTHINGYYKYNLPGSDTALMLVIFKKNGNVISTDLFKIRGTGQQLNYAPFSFALSLSTMPDSVIIAAASSNLIGEIGIEPGSTFYLDQLNFSGATAMPSISNGDMENWTVSTVYTPQGWSSQGDISRSASAYSGSYALQLNTTDFNGGNFEPAGITNGYFTENSGPKGGRPYTLQTDTLKGYYRYNGSNQDSAQVYLNFYKNGMNFFSYTKRLGTAGTYTYFEIPFNLNQAPDTINIQIQSAQWPPTGPSTLFLDKLYLGSQPLGLFEEAQDLAYVFPNPASDKLHINFGEPVTSGTMLKISNILGETVFLREIEAGATETIFNINQLAPGIYVCTAKNVVLRFVKQ